MQQPTTAGYLRSHRKNAGLSQSELAGLLGFLSEGQVSRYERGALVPTFIAAVTLEVIFCVSIAELFPGIYDTIRDNVEHLLAAFETELQDSSAKGREAALIARKLEWLWMRRNPDIVPVP